MAGFPHVKPVRHRSTSFGPSRYKVTMRYKDGGERTTTVNASTSAEARKAVNGIARNQMRDHSFGGDKSAGLPRIVKVERA